MNHDSRRLLTNNIKIIIIQVIKIEFILGMRQINCKSVAIYSEMGIGISVTCIVCTYDLPSYCISNKC